MKDEDDRKKYMREYMRKNRRFIRVYKREWMRANRAGMQIDVMTVREKIVSDPDMLTASFTGIPITYKHKDHCKRCDKLYKYGGNGDGINCSECVEELQNGTKPYITKFLCQIIQ